MAGCAHNQEALLQAMEPGVCLTMDELATHETLGLERKQIAAAAAGLMDRDFLFRREVGCYELTQAGVQARENEVILTSGPNKPLTGAPKKRPKFRGRVWRFILASEKFTLGEVVAAARRNERNPESNAGKYLAYLVKAGYLRELPRMKGTAPTSNGFKRYAVLKKTGPLAPVIRSDRKGREDRKVLWDPNTQERIRLWQDIEQRAA